MRLFPLLTPAGSDSYIQYNNGGIFGGDSTFTFNDATKLVTALDISITTPSSIYSLSHDSFADFVANEHIDWTAASENFYTTGTGRYGNVVGIKVAPVSSVDLNIISSHSTDSANYGIFQEITQSAITNTLAAGIASNVITTHGVGVTIPAIYGYFGGVTPTSSGTVTNAFGIYGKFAVGGATTPTISTLAIGIASECNVAGGSALFAFSSWNNAPTVGAGSVTIAGSGFFGETSAGAINWSILAAGDVGIYSDKKLQFEAGIASVGDTYLVYDSAGATLDCFVNATEAWNANTTTFTVPIVGHFGGATNYSQTAADGTITQAGTARIDWTKKAANGVTLTNFTSADTVADLQSHNDGNTYTCTEVAGGNNHLVVDFTNVTAFNWVEILAYYAGNATHNITVQLEITPFDGSAWHTFDSIEHQGASTNTMQNHSFFVPSDTAYINSGVVKVRLLHSATTVAGHVLVIDECSLYQ